MATIYQRLNPVFIDNTSSSVSSFSSGVTTSTQLMPQLLKPWQQSDVGNGNVGGYFQNPVANVTNSILTLTNQIINYSNIANVVITADSSGTLINTIINTANTLSLNTLPSYTYVTNRESNVVDIGSDITTPHYKTAVGYGKLLVYLTSQSDNIQNNSPVLAGLTSILIGNTLNSLYQTLNTYTNTFINSINGSAVSNISNSSAQTLVNTLTNLNFVINDHITIDTQYAATASSIIQDFSTVNQFNNLGQTETYLINNLIGTPKLLTRLNTGVAS